MDFSLVSLTQNDSSVGFLQKAQNDKVRRHCKMTKRVLFVRHCERARRAWQSINLSKLYHKNSSKALKNLKIQPTAPKHTTKIFSGLPRICTLTLYKFSQWQSPCHTALFAVILSVAKYPLAKSCFVAKKHNTKSLFCDKNPTNAFDFKKHLFVNMKEFDFA